MSGFVPPVCWLVIAGDQPHNHCVIREFDDGVSRVDRLKVVGEEGKEERAQDTSLGHTGVQGDGDGGVAGLVPVRSRVQCSCHFQNGQRTDSGPQQAGFWR